MNDNNNTITEKWQCSSFIIAAPASGCGKTTITLGLMRSLVRKGFLVQPYKIGPDYLDGLWHRAAAGRSSYNLDTWMLGTPVVRDHFLSTFGDADFGIVEGVMGLFDGYEGKTEGSTAECAIALGFPIILVINCKGMAGSVAPLVKGFRDFNKECTIAGVICNNVGSELHAKYLKDALTAINVKVFGCIPRDETLHLAHRHLGLVAEFSDEADKKIDLIADTIDRNIDIEALKMHCSAVQRNFISLKSNSNDGFRCRIAVAYDNAFNFYYQANLDLLQDCGAEIVFFSPLYDISLPQDVHGLYFGGGYPEEYAGVLSKNTEMRQSVHDFSRNGGCIYAECGGYMYLGSQLLKDTVSYPMCGIFKSNFVMSDAKRKKLGYREAVFNNETVLGNGGSRVRGHEFHYSYCENPEEQNAPFSVVSRSGSGVVPAGEYVNHTLGSYLHIHFLSYPSVADNFVKACVRYKQTGGRV